MKRERERRPSSEQGREMQVVERRGVEERRKTRRGARTSERGEAKRYEK